MKQLISATCLVAVFCASVASTLQTVVDSDGHRGFYLGDRFSNNQTTFTPEEGNSQECIQWGDAPQKGVQYCYTDTSVMGVVQRVDLNSTFFLWNLPNGTSACQVILGPNDQTIPTFAGGKLKRSAFYNHKPAKLYQEVVGQHKSATWVVDGWESSGDGELYLLNNFLGTTYQSRNQSSVPSSTFEPPSYCYTNGAATHEWVPNSDELWAQSSAYIRSGGKARKFPTPDLTRPIHPRGSGEATPKKEKELEASIAAFDKKLKMPAVASLPASLDNRHYASPVRNDAGCWSGWAFATIAAIEVSLNRYTSTHRPGPDSWLSVQQVLDCTMGATIYENRGCYHGNPIDAMNSLSASGGIMVDSDYQYTAVTGSQCQYNATNPNNNPTYTPAPAPVPLNATQIKQHIVRAGAVIALMTDSAGVNYAGQGVIYANPSCPKGTNHAVAILGWGKDDNDVEYWIAKNSWGGNWGEQGYWKIKAGVDMCGIEANIIYYA